MEGLITLGTNCHAMSSWKRDVASGLVVLVPILVTAYIVSWLYGLIAQVPLGMENTLNQVLFTLAVFALLVLAIGYLMRTAVGTLVESSIDTMMNQVPGLRVVYNASKMAVETAVSGPSDLQTPVKIEAWDGMRMTAFKTGKQVEDGREVLFMPTAPNITTGFVVEVESERITEVDETVEEALTRILSAGFGESANGTSGIPIEVTEEDEAGDVTAAK